MNIEQIDSRRILISMTENELEDYSITFEALSLSEKQTQRVLKELMDRAAQRTGISFRDKRVLIEALKYEKGCIFLLTVSDKNRKRRIFRIKFCNESYMFLFKDAESLLSCIQALYRMNTGRLVSTVYFYRRQYYLVIKSTTALKRNYRAWKAHRLKKCH